MDDLSSLLLVVFYSFNYFKASILLQRTEFVHWLCVHEVVKTHVHHGTWRPPRYNPFLRSSRCRLETVSFAFKFFNLLSIVLKSELDARLRVHCEAASCRISRPLPCIIQAASRTISGMMSQGTPQLGDLEVFDVLIIGAGPAGLAVAARLR